MLTTTFAEETETDLFGEQVVLCGGATELVVKGFETLVEAGYQPEVAYYECLHELKLIVDLLHEGGLTKMHQFISETAKYGDLTRGPRIVNAGHQARDEEGAEEIQEGKFARQWISREQAAAARTTTQLMNKDLKHKIEKVGVKLRDRMPWLQEERAPDARPVPLPGRGTLMPMPINAAKHIWYNGKLVPWEKATVHVLAHALHYGSTVFEGERAYATPQGVAIFRLRDHTRRLFDSAKIYRIDIPYTPEQINAACKEVIVANGLNRGAYLRPFAFRGYGEIGVAPKNPPPIETVDRGVRMGRLPRRRGSRERHRRVRLLLAAARTEHHPGARQGGRQLSVEPAHQHGSEAPRLRRRHRPGRRRHRQRRRRREPVR